MFDLHPSVYWLLFGLLATCLEVLAPGISLLGTGLAAIVTGIFTYFFVSFALEWQLVLFAFSAVILTILCKKMITDNRKNSTLNDPLNKWLGQEFTTEYPIEGRAVRMRIQGSYWSIKGPKIPANTKVVVTKVIDSHTLLVEPAGSNA